MTCVYCRNKKTELVLSETNSTYFHCNENSKHTYKHLAIDALLKRLLDTLNKLNEQKLIIEVMQNRGFIKLFINEEKVFKNDFNYELENKDIFYLETIISELVQDYHEYDSSQVDILVCA